MKQIVEKAKRFAITAHEGITRPNNAQEPYYIHIGEVALLTEVSGGDDIEIASAWLHDIVEDTDVTFKQVGDLFGDEVLRVVKGLTDPPDQHPDTFKRKKIQAARIKRAGGSVHRVKLADQISNLRSVVIDPPLDWTKEKRRDYIRGASWVVGACSGVSPLLDRQARYTLLAAVMKYEFSAEDDLFLHPVKKIKPEALNRLLFG